MNWYKKAQLDKYAGKGLWTAMGFLAVPAIIALIGGAAFERFKNNPEELKSQVEHAQQIEQPQQPEQPQQFTQFQQEQPEPPVIETQPTDDIDLDKIWEIESTRGTNPKMYKPNRAGALGHFQFKKDTWDEMVQLMGKDWEWGSGALDYEKSKAVADFYLNKRIPQMLKHYDMPDTTENRIGAYSWGIGSMLKNKVDIYNLWDSNIPSDLKDYLQKYNN